MDSRLSAMFGFDDDQFSLKSQNEVPERFQWIFRGNDVPLPIRSKLAKLDNVSASRLSPSPRLESTPAKSWASSCKYTLAKMPSESSMHFLLTTDGHFACTERGCGQTFERMLNLRQHWTDGKHGKVAPPKPPKPPPKPEALKKPSMLSDEPMVYFKNPNIPPGRELLKCHHCEATFRHR